MDILGPIFIGAIFLSGAVNLFLMARIYHYSAENCSSQLERLGLQTARVGIFWYAPLSGWIGLRWLYFAFGGEYFGDLKLKMNKTLFRWSAIAFWGFALLHVCMTLVMAH